MIEEIVYNRQNAVEYAKKYAFNKNEAYYDFNDIGGDCTNFVSQCVYAGCNVMNYTKEFGWYYITANDRTPSWTGVKFFKDFLLNNKSTGPYGEIVKKDDIEIGDIVFLGKEISGLYHTVVVVDIIDGEIYIASHSYDRYMYPLSSYPSDFFIYCHIIGARE